MGKILFAWELGGGLGHLGPFHEIARSLIDQGHELILAVREPSRAAKLFSDLGCAIAQAPRRPKSYSSVIASPRTYPQILCNAGYSEPMICRNLIQEWVTIVDRFSPDLIIADHAPGALFSLHDDRPSRVFLGNGFVTPPALSPIPRLDADNHLFATCVMLASDSEQQCERQLLATINSVRQQLCRSRLLSIGEVFGSGTTFLTTFAELDHYAFHEGRNYMGAIPYYPPTGMKIDWPPGSGPRIFAYLKPSRCLGRLLDELRSCGSPTLVVMDGMEVGTLNNLATGSVRFFDHPLPVDQVAKECDLAILNATHGMTCSMLLAGKPMLQIPHNLEQFITAKRSVALGAAVAADRDDGLNAVAAFYQLRNDTTFAAAAGRFSNLYRSFDPGQAVIEITAIIGQLAR